ncbi:MAG TPA: iron ABC transporter permease [Gemmatimonadaceae bacterium]|nr:iron ABC transporter permease [Gemmatimonadaceae bacterium]
MTVPVWLGGRSRAERMATLAALPLLLILVWTVIYPNVAVIMGSMGHWREFAESPSDVEALKNSIIIAVASVAASLAIGVPLAFLLTRFDFPGRTVLRAAALLPAALPPLVGVISFLFLYGDTGVITRVVQIALRLKDVPWHLNGIGAIIFIHAYTMYVYVYLFVSAGLERYEASLDEAAIGLGAGTLRRLTRVTLPLLTPAIAGSALLVFMSALGSFSAPYVFGGGVRVLSTQILNSKLNDAIGLAYVETTVLAISAVAGLLLFRWLEGKRAYVAAGKGGASRQPVRSRWARIGLATSAALIVLVLVLPHLMIVLVSFAKDGAWTTQVLPPEYTTHNYAGLFTENQLWTPIRNSIVMSLLATAGNVVFCVAGAYLIVTRKFSGRRLLEALVALPWAIPGTAIALGLLATFNKNDLSMGKVLLVGTFWILPLAYFVRDIPLVSQAVEGSLKQMDPSLEPAARGLGASWWMAVRRVVLPAARPGIVAGALLACVTAVGEFVASIVLYTHGNRPISIEILAQLRSYAFGTASAYSALLIGLVLIMALAARFAESRMQ